MHEMKRYDMENGEEAGGSETAEQGYIGMCGTCVKYCRYWPGEAQVSHHHHNETSYSTNFFPKEHHVQTSRLSCKGMSDLIRNINHKDTTPKDDDSSASTADSDSISTIVDETTSASTTPNDSEGTTEPSSEEVISTTENTEPPPLSSVQDQEHTTMEATTAAITDAISSEEDSTPGREEAKETKG